MNDEKMIVFCAGLCKPSSTVGDSWMCSLCYNHTQIAIKHLAKHIITNQMCFLSTKLFEQGYRVFICSTCIGDTLHNCMELKLNEDLPTGRELRIGLNLFKLFEAGELDDRTRMKMTIHDLYRRQVPNEQC